MLSLRFALATQLLFQEFGRALPCQCCISGIVASACGIRKSVLRIVPIIGIGFSSRVHGGFKARHHFLVDPLVLGGEVTEYRPLEGSEFVRRFIDPAVVNDGGVNGSRQ